MTLLAFVHWLSATTLSQLIQTTSWAIPAIQVMHILCLATLFALVLNLSLRLAGRGLAAESLRSLTARFVPIVWLCLGLLLLSGSLLIIAEPERTLTNQVFYLKMGLLLPAVALLLWLVREARREPAIPSRLKVAAAAVWMALWTGIIIAGRYIAYYIA